ncbi:MAG: serine/threonine-protein kinase [Gammaproteobacteria bacterium]|nr:serine/threonine-protein kinase [Gammaproteobacteria bacterium]
MTQKNAKTIDFQINASLVISRYAIKYCSMTSTRVLDEELSINDCTLKQAEKLAEYTQYLKKSYAEIAQHLRNANSLYSFAIFDLVGPLETFDERYECDNENNVTLSFSVTAHNAIFMPVFPGITAYDFCQKIRSDETLSLHQFFSLTQAIVSAFMTMAKNGSRHGDVNAGNILIDQKSDDVYRIHILDTEHSCFLGEALDTTTGDYFYWSHDRTYQPEGYTVLETEYHDIYGLLKIFVSLIEHIKPPADTTSFCVMKSLQKRMSEYPEKINTFDCLTRLLMIYDTLSSAALNVTLQQLEHVLNQCRLHKQLMLCCEREHPSIAMISNKINELSIPSLCSSSDTLFSNTSSTILVTEYCSQLSS